jgi:AbiV family abortive infection protein
VTTGQVRAKSPPADSSVRIAGAELVARNARREVLAASRLLRADGPALGPAAALYATAVEEAIKAWVLATSANSTTPEVETLLRDVLSHHDQRLRVGNVLVMGVEPGFAAIVAGLAVIQLIAGNDLKQLSTGLGLNEKERYAGMAAFVWNTRNRGLYVDWAPNGWTDPTAISSDEIRLIRRLAGRFVRFAERTVRAAQGLP